MASLFAAALFFDGIHFFISGIALHGKIVGLVGEIRYQGLFSLMSLIGIVWRTSPRAVKLVRRGAI
jgi:NnrU protein